MVRYREKTSNAMQPIEEKLREENPPYFQQTGELDARENAVREFEAR